MDIYPKTSGNIKKSILFENKDQKTYCIGCLENDRYIYLPEKEADIIYLILSNMDGQTSLEEINQIIKGDFDKKVNIMEVYYLCLNSGLIKPIDGEKAKPKKDELEALVVNLKSFCLHRLHPFLEKINLILPLILCIMMVIDLASIGLSVFNLNNFPWQLLLSNPIVIIYLLIISLVSLVIHEFSHAIMAYRYGIKPKSFTVGIFAFFHYYSILKFQVYICSHHLKE